MTGNTNLGKMFKFRNDQKGLALRWEKYNTKRGVKSYHTSQTDLESMAVVFSKPVNLLDLFTILGCFQHELYILGQLIKCV